ncbi:glyoxylase-like metal-dependent hydrolase (beta-lactamase superfamily II) [Maritimibacter alkaliphilus HTCC2654]|nr:MBL fold metallo-hydrolase [Maritimibacter alkaliphilus]TYP85383.1 glyoxylase-like metal-dependent hydrolase (beta-lactamase superfamily II) [Maritimibacter alkaliphilus HTCC2654]
MLRKSTPALTRRGMLLGAAGLSLASGTALAKADLMMPGMTGFKRFKIGNFDVVTLMAGHEKNDAPHDTFGRNISDEAFAAASDAARIPAHWAQTFFTPTLVNTGEALVLFDTGPKPAGTVRALETAGYFVEDIDVVVLTHMHIDHIGGLHGPNSVTFPNARYVCGSMEFDAWDDTGSDVFDRTILPLKPEIEFVAEGDTVVPGITAIEAFGHTLGHMMFMVESTGEHLLLAADFACHHVWSLAYPDWEMRLDEDKEQAAKTRKAVLEMLASDKIPFIGYHMPWPSVGYVDRLKDGRFHYVPESYQLLG